MTAGRAFADADGDGLLHMLGVDRDKKVSDNTRGLGVALRFAGALIPPVVAFVVFLFMEGHRYGADVASGAGADILRVVSAPWAWPYAMWDQQPFTFGLLGLGSLLAIAVLLLRRDRRGAVVLAVWSLFVGALFATIVGQAQGY